MTVEKRSLSVWIKVIALMSAMTFILCAVMSWHSLSGTQMLGCGVGSSCDTVLGSRWSMLFGIIPVSGLAVGVYLAIFVCNLFAGFSSDSDVRTLAWRIMLLMSGAIAGSALWFVVLQKLMVHAFCRYCMSAHIAGLLLSAAIVIGALKSDRGASRRLRLLLVGMGVMLAVALAVTQLLTTPKSVFEHGDTEEALPTVSRFDGPIIGNRDAEYVVNLLFDYQCSHCQTTHGIVEQAVEMYQGKLAVALCPSPLCPKCNPYVPPDSDLFEGSCELTRLALALWRVDTAAFRKFDRWLFDYDTGNSWYPRKVDAAMAEAARLIGDDVLEKAMNDEWIDRYVAVGSELFGRTSSNGKGGIPRLIYGSQWIIPEVDSPESMVELFMSVFGLPAPDSD